MVMSSSLQFCKSYLRLTTCFLILDLELLQEEQFASLQEPEHYQPPMFASRYLQQFGVLCGNLHILWRGDYPPSVDIDYDHVEFNPLNTALSVLQDHGPSLQGLSDLLCAVARLASSVPRIVQHISPLCQVTLQTLQLSSVNIKLDTNNTALDAGNLHGNTAFKLWEATSEQLLPFAEKAPSSLPVETIINSILVMTEFYKQALLRSPDAMVATLKDYQTKHRLQAPIFVAEAMAWRWHFGLLDSVIRSAQLQLRVMAIGTLCSNLNFLWQRFKNSAKSQAELFLSHVAQGLKESKLFEYLTGPACHPEIALESSGVIGFLIVNKHFQTEDTDRLWQVMTSSSSPRLAETLTLTMGRVTHLFAYPWLEQFCQKLQTLPLESFTPAVRDFFGSVLHAMTRQCCEQGLNLSIVPYQLCLRLLREACIMHPDANNILDPEMRNLAIAKFRDLWICSKPTREDEMVLYMSCIDDLVSKQSPTTLGSLYFLNLAYKSGGRSVMDLLVEQYDFASSIAQELEHKLEKARIAGCSSLLSQDFNLPRNELIVSLICIHPKTMDSEAGTKLWSMLVGSRSLSSSDRNKGWDILLAVLRDCNTDNNSLRTRFTCHLAQLQPETFCKGTLIFIKDELCELLDSHSDFMIDDDEEANRSILGPLWKLALHCADAALSDEAAHTLIVDVYLDSLLIQSFTPQRARRAHLTLITRCFQQLEQSVRTLEPDLSASIGDPPECPRPTGKVPSAEVSQRVFVRCLKLLRKLIEAHQYLPRFTAPDLRASPLDWSNRSVTGELVDLAYRTFDNGKESDIKTITIDTSNTIGFLLTGLQYETGFDNYQLFQAGRRFQPDKQHIHTSLHDKPLGDEILMIKREEGAIGPCRRAQPWASTIEVEILMHYEKLWEFLGMEETLAEEVRCLRLGVGCRILISCRCIIFYLHSSRNVTLRICCKAT